MREHPISRRNFLAGTAAAAVQVRRPTGSRRPNILHVMVDQMQWGAIAGRSGCRTPHLNRLAAGGILFGRSYTPSAVCCPARAMLISGAYHWHNGVSDPACRAEVDEMRARLHEMMTNFGDPFGDPSRNMSAVQRDGAPPNRYGAPRYLPRGRRKI